MEIKILGTGCPKCKSLEKAVAQVVEDQKLDARVSREEDIMKIMEYGILRTPGLVVDGKLVLSGRVPSPGEIEKLLNQ